MNSEKVKEIKKCLVFCKDRLCEVCPRLKQEPNQEEDCRCALIEQSLTLINELGSENKELKKYRCDWLNSEKMHLQADMEDTEFELASSNRILEKVSKENQQLKDRIAELEEHKEKWQRKAVNYYKMAKSYGIECIIDNDIDETLKEFL